MESSLQINIGSGLQSDKMNCEDKVKFISKAMVENKVSEIKNMLQVILKTNGHLKN